MPTRTCLHPLVPQWATWWNFHNLIFFSGETTSTQTPVVPIPEYTAREELEDEKNWRSVTIGDKKYKIDMKVIEPYKKVLSHGGEAQTS